MPLHRTLLGLPLKLLFASLLTVLASAQFDGSGVCRAGYLSCETVSHPEVCCPMGYVCSFDRLGTIACCEFKTECHGSVVPQNLTQFQIPAPGSVGVAWRVDPMWWILGLGWVAWRAANQ